MYLHNFQLYEKGKDAYELTGLARGGEQIRSVKEKFRDALRVLADLASQQTSFIILDMAVKTAYRRVNAIEHGNYICKT